MHFSARQRRCAAGLAASALTGGAGLALAAAEPERTLQLGSDQSELTLIDVNQMLGDTGLIVNDILGYYKHHSMG